MLRLPRSASAIGGEHVIAALGALYVVLAGGRVTFVVAAGGPIVEALIDFALVGGPGIVILVVGYRLPETGLHPRVYPRIVAWCLGGFWLMLAVVGLLVLNPSVTVDHLLWTLALATGIGAVGGLAVGTNEGRAITQAYETERRNRELKRQNDRLESFASMLAHEVRNPLAIAQGYLRFAVDGDEAATAEVTTALDRIEEMIDVLLLTARGAESTIEYEDVALSDVAADAWGDRRSEEATLVIETERAVRADRVHLRHLLENLFRNAVEHGGVGVTVRVGDLPAGFYVEDDGRGIPEAKCESVFDAGYTTQADGIGLGLTFVAQLVEAYDWDCTVTESEAGGARFEFTAVDSPERRRAN